MIIRDKVFAPQKGQGPIAHLPWVIGDKANAL